MTPEKVNHCPACGSSMEWGTRTKPLSYKDATATVDLQGWWCDCGEGILDGKALAVQERAYMTLKASVDQVLAPAEVTEIREKLGLTKRQAGRILGGGIKAFEKYESGRGAVSAPMTNLLHLLKDYPALLKKLPAYEDVKPKRPISIHKKQIVNVGTKAKGKSKLSESRQSK